MHGSGCEATTLMVSSQYQMIVLYRGLRTGFSFRFSCTPPLPHPTLPHLRGRLISFVLSYLFLFRKQLGVEPRASHILNDYHTSDPQPSWLLSEEETAPRIPFSPAVVWRCFCVPLAVSNEMITNQAWGLGVLSLASVSALRSSRLCILAPVS